MECFYRVNASGVKTLQLQNISLSFDPLHNRFQLLDVNYIFVFIVASILYKYKEKFVNI